MITLQSHKKKVFIPDCWDELSVNQYLQTIDVINEMSEGKLNYFDAKLRLLQIVSGYKRSRKRRSEEAAESINNNLTILAEMIRFVFRPEYPDQEVMEVFSPELRQLLHERFPFEIYNLEMRDQLNMVGDRLKYSIAINLDMRHNPIPIIKVGWKTYQGPQFDIDKNNILTTDMLAEEYIDALSYYRLYHQTKEQQYLNGMVAVLYRQNRADYKTIEAQRRATVFENTPETLKKGIFFFFQSIQEYLLKRSPYTLLYGAAPAGEEKITLGLIDTLYSLSKDGYGSKEELGKYNLQDFLNLRMKQIIDAVHQLRSSGKKPHEIAESLHLPIETILNI